MATSLLSPWPLDGIVRGIGNPALPRMELAAFFASRQCPGAAIRAALDWAVEQAKNKRPVIGGFHSPLEKSILEVLLSAGSPVVIVIARNLEKTWLPSPWHRALRTGRAAVVSIDDTSSRLTTERAFRRNEWVARHAQRVVVAYAAPDGRLAHHVAMWKREGLGIEVLISDD